MKRSFFQAAVVSTLLYGCTTWTLTKRLKKKLDGNYTRMLQAILNKSWRQHPTRHQLYGHLPPVRKTIPVRRTRHARHCWRSKDELISDVLLWTPSVWPSKKQDDQLKHTYSSYVGITGCNPEDLPEAMNDREKWRERVRDIRASGMTWWWWLVYQDCCCRSKERIRIYFKIRRFVFVCVCVWVCILGSFVVLKLLEVLSPIFVYIYTFLCICVCVFLSSENMFGIRSS